MVSLLRIYDFIRAATFHYGRFRNKQSPCVSFSRCPVDTLRMASTFFLSVGKDSVPCRMLLDTGSDRTYLVQKIAEKLKGKPIRHETVILDSIHGNKSHRCGICNLEIRNMEGEAKLTTEAAMLSRLTTVKDARPEVVQQRFEHLKDIKFSDVSENGQLPGSAQKTLIKKRL